MTDTTHTLKASYFTLGCKLNYAETSAIGKMLLDKGIIRAAKGESPDICVVNTCSVTEMADKKGRHLIRNIHTRFPDAKIIVTGCYAQLKPTEVVELPGVALVLGSDEKLRISEFIDTLFDAKQPAVKVSSIKEMKEFHPSCERGDRTRYFLKVQDGCDYYCTYCTIPFARGHSRSGLIPQLVTMAEEAAQAGGKEIVITGVNIGEFGKDNSQSLFELLRALDRVNGIERFRISSIEPNLLSEEIIRWTATEARAFMPHFHIPLQSGSDKVLRLMNRRYDTSLFTHRIDSIKKYIPDAFIGVDIIAGARGETAEEWSRSLAFAESLPVSRYHIFPYSERPGTAALYLGEAVSQEEKHHRVAQLTAISDKKMTEFMESNAGRCKPVLWEHPSDSGTMHGLTDNYIRVEAPLRDNLINKISYVKLESMHPNYPEMMRAIHCDS